MQSVNLFELASQQAKWVSAQQKVVASNIANVNTQNYAPVEIEPFKEVLRNRASTLAITDPRHVSTGTDAGGFKVSEREPDPGKDAKVQLQDELMAASSARRTYELNTAIVKSFHRMIMMTVRS